ncbi:MAG: succinylglutamate desuccinylase/aspartoacylase family protein [bacterium]|nr:succinylglutamate desuccinylase/aspartoacylase family protein [bacterium]
MTQFQDIFNQLVTSFIDGVAGVIRIDSGKPGSILGITACTHGNEPSGLAIFEYLLKERNIEKELRCGTLYLVVNNIQATKRFFDATSEEEIRKSRYCDVNMNRLPKNTLELENDSRYEVMRFQELYPVWKRFEYGLDVHSTLDPSEPMIISRGGEFHSDLVRGFPIKKLISNIDKVQIGIPAFAFYGGLESKAKVFAIEAGQHTDPISFERASVCAVSLLQNLNMLPSTQQSIAMEYNEYHIDDSIVFPDISFDFVRDFESYEEIHKGELLALNTKGEEIRSAVDGHLIMPTSRRGADKDISEEVAFISQPVKIRSA